MDGREQRDTRSLIKGLVISAVGALLVQGCASMGGKPDGGAVGQVIRDSGPAAAEAHSTGSVGAVVNRLAGTAPTNGPVEVWGRTLKNSKFDLPVIVTPTVEQWITYFTGKGRLYFSKYLERGRYFIPVISRVLKAHNMPQDLVYLAMIESGFNNSAKSRARAVGPWQFIRQTGARYGLSIDYWLDERRDTRKATLAAIAYLKELYEEFGSWELAAAGYNAGENKVRRAIAKYRTNDFWEIARHRFFKRETRDYVPKIMAAAILTKNPELFGFVNPFDSKNFKNPTLLTSSDDTETSANGAPVIEEEPTPKELGEPVVKDDSAEDPTDVAVADAEDDSTTADDEEENSDSAAMVSRAPTPTVTPSMYMVANPNEQIVEFEVKGPADLFAISKASGLPYSTIKTLNPELLRWCTPPSMKAYRVRLTQSVKDRFLATYNDDAFDRRVVFMRYKVRRGDSVQKVAKLFSVEAPPIRELNQLDLRASTLRAGSSINLPIPTGYKRVIASMYDEKPEKASRRHRRRRHRRSQTSSAQHYIRQRPRIANAG